MLTDAFRIYLFENFYTTVDITFLHLSLITLIELIAKANHNDYRYYLPPFYFSITYPHASVNEYRAGKNGKYQPDVSPYSIIHIGY